jgi:O-antigen/teichoic acid export membrane protein
VANFVGRAISAASIYLFIPLYLRFLGIEAYGIVGFFVVLQALLAFADIGLTATLSRELARLSARDDASQEMRDLLCTVERVYWAAALGAALVVAACAGPIADHWLNAQGLAPDRVTMAVRLMGAAAALQLPAGLYLGGILGRERQVLANALQVGWSLVRGGGAVLVLWLVSPTVDAFFTWQITVSALYVLAARYALGTVLPAPAARPRFRVTLLRQVWRYAAGMTGMALLSGALTQSDRLIVSKLLSLDQFGYYVLAGAVAQAPVLIVGPVAAAVFPRFTVLAAAGDRRALSELYHRVCQVASVLAISVGLTVALFSYDLVRWWTGSATTAQEVRVVVMVLSLGSTLLALQVIPYNLALAHGWTSLNLGLSVVSAAIIVPLLILLVGRLGLLGGGISWLCFNAAVTPPFIYLLHRRLLPGETRRWYVQDIGRPLVGALTWVALGRWLFPTGAHGLVAIASIGAVGAAALATAALNTPGLIAFALRSPRAGKPSLG